MFEHMPSALITRPQELQALMERVAREPRIALDTEGASFHRYVDRVYLIQVSTELDTALIDPLALPDLSALGAVLASEAVEIVVHDADYDLRVLDRDYGFRVRRIFDTRIAAQLVGEPAVGLAALLEKYFGIRLNKKLQRADWSVRPLPPDMLAYAAADTQHLLRLRDLLADRLAAAGRTAWAEEEFQRLEQVRWAAPTHDSHLRLKGAKVLSPTSQAVLRALFAWREKVAGAHDRSPFRVFPNEALLALARAVPRSLEELALVRGVPRTLARRHGGELLAAIEDGLASPPERPQPTHSRRERSDPAAVARFERLKALRNRRAAELGLEPGVVCPNGTLHAVARAAPRSVEDLQRVEELRRWQIEALGAAPLLAAAADPPPQ
jgi:ribonuclease D